VRDRCPPARWLSSRLCLRFSERFMRSLNVSVLLQMFIALQRVCSGHPTRTGTRLVHVTADPNSSWREDKN
jgi:hypothetical protein